MYLLQKDIRDRFHKYRLRKILNAVGESGKISTPFLSAKDLNLPMFSRRRYTSTDMNTDELMWNIRIAKKMMDDNLSVTLDGFDLLGQLSSVRNVITAEGRQRPGTMSSLAMPCSMWYIALM